MGKEQLQVADFRATLDQTFDLQAHQAEFVDGLVRLYVERDLINSSGNALPLHLSCPRCGVCWKGDTALTSANPEDQRVPVPWVGPKYRKGGVLLVGINLHDYGGLASNWWFCSAYARDQRDGKRGGGNHTFAYGAALYANAILACLDGHPLTTTELPEPEALAYIWDRCALTEAIKCAPATPRSEPLDPMFQECPDLLLLEEFALLEPRVVVLLGRSRLRDTVRPLLRERSKLAWGGSPGCLEWDGFDINGLPAALFSLNHPSGRNPAHWQRGSYPKLLDALPTALAN